jgi:phosphoribosylaminoimidazole-succinocarboxamide synthase
LMSNGFQGKENQIIPEMSNDYIKGVSNRYIELYEKITGLEFVKEELNRLDKRIETNILNYFDV